MSAEQELRSLWLCSLPRSGSNFITSEITCMTEYPLLREPLRRILGYPHDSVSACQVGQYEGLDDLFQQIKDPIKRYRLTNIFQDIKESAHLIKETDGIFFLEPMKASMPNLPIVYIHRPYGAVLASHLAIKDIYFHWNYDKRIRAARNSLTRLKDPHNRFSKYLNIYARAEKFPLEENHLLSLMAAHLGIQALELKYLTPILNLIPIDYEAVAVDPEGELQNLLKTLSITYQTRSRLPVNNGITTYPHKTKLSPEQINESINRWRSRFKPQDFDTLQSIFGESFDILFPEINNLQTVSFAPASIPNQKIEDKPETTSPKNTPDFKFIELNIDGWNIHVGNIPVCVETMCTFLNEMVAKGIEAPHQLLCMDISKKEIYYDVSNGTYSINPKSDHHPITHVSPIAAAVFSLHHGAKLGSVSLYQKIHRQLYFEDHCNHAEIFPTTTSPGLYPPSKEGIYDFFGNIKEICLGQRQAYVYGGSFCDEPHVTKDGITAPFPVGYSDRNIGFRLMKDPATSSSSFNATDWLHQIRHMDSAALQTAFEHLISMAALD